ncbi:MAG: putative aminopeptidase [Verrucomicrobiales bacterium]|jgi:predicted aminopeptidase
MIRLRLKWNGLGAASVATALLLSSCQSTWYGQAVRGQVELLKMARPAAEVISDPETSDDVSKRLKLVQQLLEFAESNLELPHDGNYSSYVDLDREAVMWAVYASTEFDIAPVEWRAPVVGKISYRGYFKKEDAEAFAENLRTHRGLETAIVPVPAYSTLGWFRDPILSTFLDYDEADLAALIFHELTHKKFYVAGDTEFNEALAVAVEQEGVRRWLTSRGEFEALAAYEKQQANLMDFVKRLLDLRQKLHLLYSIETSPERMRASKQRMFGELQSEIREKLRDAGKDADDTFWLRDDLNNAHLNLAAVYFLRVPEFQAELQAVDGDLVVFFKRLSDR